jgi:hypothetical protein
MAESTELVKAELESLGYQTSVFDTPRRRVVSFPYTIETGPHKGKEVSVGVGFDEGAYPEYPPHWVYVTPPLSDGKGGAIEKYVDGEGRTWIAMSRPPGDLWDRLPTKHMDSYIKEHLRRIWSSV